jgi:hypothetical protein
MSEPHDLLDEGLRRRVAELYGHAAAVDLDAAAQARVLRAATAEAARLVRVRKLRRVAGASVVLLAAAALLLALRPRATRPELPKQASASVAACRLPEQSALAFEETADARKRLALGAFGVLWSDANASVRVESASACELSIALERGELAGDLHSLRPGRLVIHTAAGAVIVTGTRFSVRADDGLEVLLASGVVDVVFSRTEPVRMRAGTRLSTAHSAKPGLSPLSAADLKRLDGLLTAAAQPIPPSAPRPTAEAPGAAPARGAAGAKKPAVPEASSLQLLEAAEAARRAGHNDQARALYRAAGSRNDDNGEVALLRWVRLELAEHAAAAAQGVLDLHAQHFAHGRLGAEAGWLQLQVFQTRHETAQAQQAARRLIAAYGGTPQAEAAARLLRGAP